MEDTLSPLPTTTQMTSSSYQNAQQQQQQHLKTYTAGEDGSRLKEMAKQFGLEHHRKPRKQVRDEAHHKRQNSMTTLLANTGQRFVHFAVTDWSVEAARMRAVYSLIPPVRASFSEFATEHDTLLSTQQYQRQRKFQRHGSNMPDWLEQIEHEEEDLHASGVGGDLTSAVLGIVKGMVGPAILYLPHGLANAGFAIALPMMVVSTCMFLYSSQCLLDAWKMEHSKMKQLMEHDNQIDTTATPDSIREEEEEGQDDEENNNNNNDIKDGQPKYKMTFLSYPELAYRAMGETGERAVKLGIGLMQSGVCLTYLVFVPQNLSTALQRLTGIYLSPEWLLLVMVGLQIPLSWIRDIRKLTITNALANALILYGLITCLVLAVGQAVSTADEQPGELAPPGPLEVLGDRFHHLAPFAKDWFLFIGTSVSFCYGLCLVFFQE